MKTFLFSVLCSLCLFSTTSAQSEDQYYNNNFLRYSDFVYVNTIHTVQLTKENWGFSAPVITLGSDERLKLTFDDFSNESKNYHFTFVHCTANWEPDTYLLPSEYINGFFDDNINNYQYSQNTIQHYVHYELLFPTDNIKPAKSGNYLLKVFLDYDQQNIVITRRFMVVDDRIQILTTVHRPTIIEDYNSMQQVDFTLNTSAFSILNPYQDLKVVVMQNDRWDNAKTNLKPIFVKDNELTYNSDQENIFSGGNEFRNFDIKSLRWHSEYIQSIGSDSLKNYYVYLFPGKKRSYLQYFSDNDINGRYKIVRQESSPAASDIEAEYVYVHFTLATEQVTDGGIYIMGELTGWQYTNTNKMYYNKSSSQYEATLYLKQGYYNYEFVYMKDGTRAGDESYIEGSHYETENDYSIYVYYKPVSSNYDQLIGMKRFNSVKY